MCKINLNFRTWRSPNLWRPAPCFQQFQPFKTKNLSQQVEQKRIFEQNFACVNCCGLRLSLLVFVIPKDPIDGFLASEEGEKLGGGPFFPSAPAHSELPEFSRTQNRSFSNQYLP